MKKFKLFFVGIFVLMVFTLRVSATSLDSPVGKDLSLNQCTSKFQDKAVSTKTSAYFSHCMKVVCNNYSYKLEYYSDSKVACLNGNSDPYVKVVKNGCLDYQSVVCSNNDVKYCSRILQYDCTKKSNGSAFQVATKPTSGVVKTTTTTTVVPKDSRLQSLSFSVGSITFNSDVYSYDLRVESTVNSIDVNAVPVDSSSNVSITGNDNIVKGSVIEIKVTATDGNVSIYKVNILKEDVVLSNNNRLSSIEITGYQLQFNPRTTYYSLIVDSDVTSLDVQYTKEDEKSNVVVSGNDNVKSSKQVVLTVTAEDGTVQYYNIDVIFKKKSNFLSIFFVIIIVIALGAGGFYLYKKFFAGKSGDKYEYE